MSDDLFPIPESKPDELAKARAEFKREQDAMDMAEAEHEILGPEAEPFLRQQRKALEVAAARLRRAELRRLNR